MPINTSDLLFSVIKETVVGTTPTTGTRLELPVKVDQAPPTLTVAQIEDETKRPNRESNAAASGHAMTEFDLDMHMRGGAVMDLLIESAISGAFTGTAPAKASGGTADSTFTVFSLLKSGAAGAALLYEDAGCMVRSLGITASAKEGAEVSVGILGLKRTEKTSDNSLAVVKTPATAVRHLFSDVTVTVSGQTLAYSALDFSTEQDRDVRVVLGSLTPADIYTSGTRQTKLTIKAYRESFGVNALANQVMSVSFTIGTAGNGYKITLPAAKLMTPTDELDDSGLLVNLEFDAGYDATTNTGVIVEKL